MKYFSISTSIRHIRQLRAGVTIGLIAAPFFAACLAVPALGQESWINQDLESALPQNADEAWQLFSRQSPPGGGDGSEESHVAANVHQELFRRYYRTMGMKFWTDFPNDPRRFIWFHDTVGWPGDPLYWKDPERAARFAASREGHLETPEIDLAAKALWEKNYLALKAEYLHALQDSDWLARFKESDKEIANTLQLRAQHIDQERIFLRKCEIRRQLGDAVRAATSGRPVDLSNLRNEEIDLLDQLGPTELSGTLPFFSYSTPEGSVDFMREDPVGERAFLDALKWSRFPEVRQFALGRERVANLRREPMHFTGVTLSGDRVVLDELKGRVVLVYVWSLGCTSCIEHLPQLQKLFEEFHPRGLEIIGITLTFGLPGADNESRVRATLSAKGVTWKNCFLRGADDASFREQYGVISNPRTFLLDTSGRLDFSDVKGPALEREIAKLIETTSR